MGMEIKGFSPVYTASIGSVTTSSQSVQIPAVFKDGTSAVIISNETDGTIFFKIADSSSTTAPTATSTGTGIGVVLSGQAAWIDKQDSDYIAVVGLASLTGTVYITVGN